MTHYDIVTPRQLCGDGIAALEEVIPPGHMTPGHNQFAADCELAAFVAACSPEQVALLARWYGLDQPFGLVGFVQRHEGRCDWAGAALADMMPDANVGEWPAPEKWNARSEETARLVCEVLGPTGPADFAAFLAGKGIRMSPLPRCLVHREGAAWDAPGPEGWHGRACYHDPADASHVWEVVPFDLGGGVVRRPVPEGFVVEPF